MAPNSVLKPSDPSVAALHGPRRRLLVIQNPTSRGAGLRRFADVVAALRARGCDVVVQRTEAAGHAIDLARAAAAAGHCDVVVAAGGDGTISEVLNGLAGRALPLAVLPLGTANVLARELGLSLAPEAICGAIVDGEMRSMPLGRIRAADGTTRVFLLMAGAGFDAHVVATVNQTLKRHLGKGAYVAGSVKQLGSFGFPRYRIDIDGTSYEAASVVVAKARHYGGGFTCAPAATLADARFHVCLFERAGRLAAVRYALALARGRLAARPDYRIVQGSRIRISGPDGDPVQADGDHVAGLPVEIDMIEGGLALMTPRRGS